MSPRRTTTKWGTECNLYVQLAEEAGKIDETNPGILVKVNDFVFTARCGVSTWHDVTRAFDGMDKHTMAFGMLQRMCAQLANNKDIEVEVYPEDEIRVINNVTFEIDLIKKNTSGKVCPLPHPYE